MVYIAADGSVVQGTQKPRNSLIPSLNNGQRQAIALLVVALAIKFFWPASNPLADGAIPASHKMPHEHYKTISQDPVFVRTITEQLAATNKRSDDTAVEAAQRSKLFETMQRVDFGGPDGHVAERVDYSDLESLRVTRCSTSQSAVTAYFCGASVAGNQDQGLGRNKKGQFFGVKSFRDFVTCRHEQGEHNQGRHRRSVYRLNIGCQDHLAGYSHAWSIIAQPDGTFYWLQSFIGHYSLASWMDEKDKATGSLRSKLSLAELQARLDKIDRLQHITGWTTQANADYLELFGVDKRKEVNDKALNWKPSHRLSAFLWDEACEYPTPEENNEEDYEDDIDVIDKCVVKQGKNMLKDLEEALDDLLGDRNELDME